jgi:hypothetical protein
MEIFWKNKDFLQNLYFDFVNMYAIYQRCHNPETNPLIKGIKNTNKFY